MTSGRPRGFSLARLALASLGAATGVLTLVTALIAILRPTPVWGLVLALVGVAAAIAVMALVSSRMTRRGLGAAAEVQDSAA